MSEDIEALSELLVTPVDDTRSGASDVAVSHELEILAFANDAQWLARCEAGGGVRLMYATTDFAELLAFEADVRAGVYGPDNPAPPELLQRQEEASVIIDEGLGLVGQQLVPEDSDAYISIYRPPTGAGFTEVYLLWSGDQARGTELSRRQFDDMQFSTFESRGIVFTDEPCTSGTDEVSFSIVAKVESITRPSEWVLVYAEDVVAPVMGR